MSKEIEKEPIKAEKVKTLSGEARLDALCDYLKDSHGFHLPEEIAPKKG